MNPRLLSAALLGLCALASAAPAADRFEGPPINYRTAAPDNPAARMDAALRAGTLALAHDPAHGFLPAVLQALEVPLDSQVLVYSKTSLQQRQITPSTPRAIYFNDDVYVGSVLGGDLLEISAADPGLGAVFYSLSQQPDDPRALIRQADNCLQCHGSTLTGGYPGHVMRSVFTDAQGYPILSAGSFLTTQNSPFKDRWGGWYVTGTHGAARHMGNGLAEPGEFDAVLDREAGANLTALPGRVEAGRYLTPHSDLVALLVLAHQVQVHNLITELAFETRYALADQKVIDEILDEPRTGLSDSTQRRIASVGNRLVDALLLIDEPPLPAPVAGTSGFAARFGTQGPRDPAGRSLRELDLQTRLFKHPLSYLVYSAQFRGLPQEALDYVYQRLWKAFHDELKEPKYAARAGETGAALRDILRVTQPDLPAYWHAGG